MVRCFPVASPLEGLCLGRPKPARTPALYGL